MNILCKQDNLALRPLLDQPEEYALLFSWLSHPEISRFYGGDAAREVASIRRHVQKGDVCSCLILQQERPIGYLQFYEIPDAEEKASLLLLPYAHPYGIDLFLGEPGLLGRGIGTRCLEMVCGYLFAQKHADALCIDPRVDNQRAIRCYEKAGFSYVKTKQQGEKVSGEWIACRIMHRLPA